MDPVKNNKTVSILIITAIYLMACAAAVFLLTHRCTDTERAAEKDLSVRVFGKIQGTRIISVRY